LPVLAFLIFWPTGTRFFAFFLGMIPPDSKMTKIKNA